MTSDSPVSVRTSDLTYTKWGTQLAEADEASDRLRDFAFEGTKATAEAKGWELLQGCFERVPAGTWRGDPVVRYSWPVVREGVQCGTCRSAGHAEGDHPLPKDHPQYDAFYDATDDELAGMVSTAVAPGRSVTRPSASAVDHG